jgi:exonuclease III
MHIPNYVSGRKYPFHEAVLAVVNQWTLGPAMLIGDTNSGLPGLDEETKVFGRREESWFQALAAKGWVDVFRSLKGAERVYTWYSPNGGNGFRIDQAFVNQDLVRWVADVRYEWGKSGIDRRRLEALSDHAAVIIDFEFKLEPG